MKNTTVRLLVFATIYTIAAGPFLLRYGDNLFVDLLAVAGQAVVCAFAIREY